jgi:hypothetical protein
VSVFPSKDYLKLLPDGLPFGAFAGEIELGQHAFEPVDHFGVALKPLIGATLVKKGFDLVHRYQWSSRCRTMAGLSGFLNISRCPDESGQATAYLHHSSKALRPASVICITVTRSARRL